MAFVPSLLGLPVRVNPEPLGNQDYTDSAVLRNGDVMVVWQSPHDGFAGEFSPRMRVMAQRFDPAGQAIGDAVELHLNADFSPSNNPAYLYPRIVALDNGGFAVALLDNPVTGPADPQLCVRLYDAAGNLTGDRAIPDPVAEPRPGEFVSTVYNSTGQLSLIALKDGGLGLAWSAGYPGMLAQYAGQTASFYQAIGADGALRGPTLQMTPWVASVSYSQDRHDWVMDAAPLADGGAVVLYRAGNASPGSTSGTPDIMAQKLTAAGTPNGAPVVINTQTERQQTGARIAELADGRLVAIWLSSHDNGAWGVYGQVFDRAMRPLGGEFTAFAPSVGPDDSTISPTPDGGFIVTTLRGIYTVLAQKFDASIAPVGDPVTVASRALFPGVSHFGGAYGNSPGQWEFSPDGSALLLLAATASASNSAHGVDIWMQGFAPQFHGTQGADRLTAGDTASLMDGGTGNDTLTGGAGNDTLDGGEGRDRLDGGGGANTLRGGAGDDRYVVRTPDDVIDGEVGYSQGGGIDTVEVWFDYTLPRNVEILRLQGSANLNGTGNAAPEALVGNTWHNRLDGNGGNDVLTGKAGDDTLIGGTGADSLVGEGGADTFVIRAVSESRPGQANRDFINGFDRGEDRVDLSQIDANTATTADDAFTFIGSAGFSGVAGELRVFTFGGGNFCIVEADVNGDRVADMQVFVNLTNTMVESDFIL